MTSNNVRSQFADLSPEQRQLLFEKIRQKKLSSARRPVSVSCHDIDLNPVKLSPHQQIMLQQTAGYTGNRLIEIAFNGELTLPTLQHSIDELSSMYPVLRSRLDHTNRCVELATSCTAELIIIPADSSDQALTAIRQTLVQLNCDQHGLHIRLIEQGNHGYHLLIAAHPLMLDSYSLLRLGNQLLAMATGEVKSFELSPQCNQAQFANWSQQMLEKPFLRNEWNRLAPKSLLNNDQQVQPCSEVQTCSESLSEDFIQQYLSSGCSAKQWLCEALNDCLYSWLSHQEVTYWFSDPSLKDSEFENLLGYFPYYVPVQSQKTEGQCFNVAAQLTQMHTRYSAVSEHVAQNLCQRGSQVPMVHYHWFDVENADQSSLQVHSVRHLNSGIMLAAFEIHIVELVDNIRLDIHYDPKTLGVDQIQFLIRDLLALLKQDKNIDASKRPSLPQQLRAIWENLLQVPEIAPEKSFFELGGHSLQVTEMKFRIKQQLKLDIPISVLYELPTIEKLSSFILATHGNSLGWMQDNNSSDVEEEEEGTL